MYRSHATLDCRDFEKNNECDSGIIAGNDDFRDTCNQKNEVLIGGSKVIYTVKPDYRLVFNKRQHEFYYWLTARETNDSCIRRLLL